MPTSCSWPGLLYLPTYSFLPHANHARVGLDERSGQLFSQLVPSHETAHQWWGNRVPVATYRDSWLIEALASYSALLYLEQQPDGSALVHEWLRRYREDLLQTEEGEETLDSVGALTLGVRLDSSRRPSGYADLVYSKGPGVIHMLRELLRDPETGSDKLFFDALRHFAARGGGHALTSVSSPSSGGPAPDRGGGGNAGQRGSADAGGALGLLPPAQRLCRPRLHQRPVGNSHAAGAAARP